MEKQRPQNVLWLLAYVLIVCALSAWFHRGLIIPGLALSLVIWRMGKGALAPILFGLLAGAVIAAVRSYLYLHAHPPFPPDRGIIVNGLLRDAVPISSSTAAIVASVWAIGSGYVFVGLAALSLFPIGLIYFLCTRWL